jgi:protease I
MVIAPKYFRDEEYFIPRDAFIANHYSVTTASEKLGDIVGSKGAIANASLLLKDVSASDFDCVVFVGGQGSYAYDHNHQIHRIAQDFYSQHKLTTAICHAPILLGNAGLLHDKKATVFSDDVSKLHALGAHYMPAAVVVDGTIITANGPAASTDFAKTIISHLEN